MGRNRRVTQVGYFFSKHKDGTDEFYLDWYKQVKLLPGYELEAFLLKLIVFGKIDISDYHWTQGRRYGYPKCCIKSFTSTGLEEQPEEWSTEHIPCPECLKKQQPEE
jgi:hypothetical protein